jgi:PAS domain S-box-containing protein
MNNQDKTKDELIKELQKLQLDYDSLKVSYEKEITERKKVEEALKFTRLILDNAADTMTCIGYDGHFIDVNDAFCRSVGYSREQLLSMTVHDIDPLFPAATWSVFWEKLKQAGSLTFESVHRTKEEKLIPVEINVNFFEYEGKEYHCGFARDITERKQEEEELALLAHTIRSISESVSITDQENKILFVNDAFLKTYGYTLDELIGKSISIVRSTTTEVSVDDILRTTFQGGWQGELLNQKKDGTEFPIALSTSTVCYEKGQAIALVGIAMDITERKLAEEALHLEKDNFRHSLDDSPLGVRIATLEGNTIYANKTLLDFYGYDSLGELQKTPLKDRYTPESYVQAQKRKHQRQLGDFNATDYEISIIRKNGEIRQLKVFRKEILWNGVRQFQVICNDITERKQAEEKLRKSEIRFRRYFDLPLHGIAITSPEKGWIEVNSRICSILGYTPDELARMTWTDLTYPDDLAADVEQYNRILSGEIEQYTLDKRFIRKDGEVVWTSIAVGCVRESDGNVDYIVAYMEDITERKRAEEMLQKSELKYRNLIEQAPYIIFVVDAEGNLLHVNQTGQKMLGYSEDELCKMKTVDTYTTDEMTVGHRRLKEFRAMRAGETIFFERLMRRKDGSLFPVEINVGALVDGTAHAIIRDITERKQVEETIRNLARFPSENPDPVLRIDRNGRLLFANEASYKFLIWKLQMGKKVSSVLQKIITETLKKGIVKRIDTEHNRRVISFNIVPIVEAGYVNLYGRDITEHKQADEEIRKSKKLLEDLYKHLTEIRENERAMISRDIHDQLGQSMTVLKLDLNRMHKYITNPEAVTKLESMIELVSNTIKDVQRISSDQRPGILDELGLVSAIEWYCDEFEERTGIKCNLKLDDSDYSDSRINLTFFRVLQETLINVIRHAKASSVNIKLQKQNKGITMTIKDDGIGIPEEKLRSTKSLGLISMRERVKQFNGTIDISSEKDNGTKFVVFIPS